MGQVVKRAPQIALNAHLLNLSGNYRSAGINWYIYHLLRNLADGEFQYTVFTSQSDAARYLPALRVRQSHLPTNKPVVRVFWEQFVQPRMLQSGQFDLYHGLAFAGPLSIRVPWLVTVYDLSFHLYPQTFNPANRMYLSWAVRDASRRAQAIIAISESTKRDLVTHFGADVSKVFVVHGAADSSFSIPSDHASLDKLHSDRNLADPIILHVGTIEPRKNIVRLLKAFKRAKRTGNLPHRLVLIGARGWKYNEVDVTVRNEGLEDCVQFAGYVPPDDLPNWYRSAQIFVYPSLYEGFGLPPLEAMACGVPVIASNTSSVPEVVGDAGVLVSPEDEKGLADAIVRLAKHEDERRELMDRGLKRARLFSWERTANQTMDVYRRILATEDIVAKK